VRPLAVLIAIVFGSSAAISFGLLSTLIVFFFLRNKHAEIATELPQLLLSSAVVLVMTASAGASLYSSRWRGLAFGAMCLIMLGGGLILWPQA